MEIFAKTNPVLREFPEISFSFLEQKVVQLPEQMSDTGDYFAGIIWNPEKLPDSKFYVYLSQQSQVNFPLLRGKTFTDTN